MPARTSSVSTTAGNSIRAATVETERLIKEAGLADRCRTVGGSFFEEVPAGADAYISKHSLHDWDDEHVVTILSNHLSGHA